ncbi:MAG: hypothetical protein ABI373_08870 [Flavobacteriales bacterium]
MSARKTIRALLLTLTFVAGEAVHAQYFRTSEYWKTHRQELTLGMGMTNFLGELGGRNAVGSPFVWDLELSQTKPAVSLGYRYYLLQKLSLRVNATYGVLEGNDDLTKEPFRQNRNLSFRSNLYEGQLCLEYFLRQEQPGHVYDLRGVQGRSSSRLGVYLFAGVGAFHFNPRAQFNGTWVDLRPLGTEGQGLPGGPAEYALTGVCIPMGLGIRKALDKKITLGLELQYTKTFTDYIDDVSGVYYDNNAIAAARGPIAAHFADPSLGDIAGQTATGQQRGQPKHNDGYMFLKFELHYKLYKHQHKKHAYRNRSKRMKIVF